MGTGVVTALGGRFSSRPAVPVEGSCAKSRMAARRKYACDVAKKEGLARSSAPVSGVVSVCAKDTGAAAGASEEECCCRISRARNARQSDSVGSDSDDGSCAAARRGGHLRGGALRAWEGRGCETKAI